MLVGVPLGKPEATPEKVGGGLVSEDAQSAARVPMPAKAGRGRFGRDRTRSFRGGGRHQARCDGAVNSSTMSTITGVRTSDMMNVPINPMRRWLPQIPTSTQNTMYEIKTIG